jgi:prevent-host-death family protein
MAISVGIMEAKSKLGWLTNRAARGEVITITRRGVPVARLGPAFGIDRAEARRAVEGWVKARAGNRLGGRQTVRGLIEEGRR